MPTTPVALPIINESIESLVNQIEHTTDPNALWKLKQCVQASSPEAGLYIVKRYKHHKGTLAGFLLQALLAPETVSVADRQSAFAYYLKAAQQGDARTQLLLRDYYAEGDTTIPVPQDDKLSKEWLKQAADQGNAAAQCGWGLHLKTEKRFNEAAKWFSLAAAQGHAEGQYQLGLCYEKASGVDKNEQQAFACFQAAAQQGHVEARLEWVRCLSAGTGCAVNVAQAIQEIKPLAYQGNPIAQNSLGACYDVMGAYDQAFEWLEKAAAQGLPTAQFNISLYYKEGKGGAPKDRQKAFDVCKKAADKGHLDAQNRLGIYYLEEENFDLAEQCFMTPAQLGNVFSQRNLGVVYERQGNLSQAVWWWQKAAAQNDASALYGLGILFVKGPHFLPEVYQGIEYLAKAIQAAQGDMHIYLSAIDILRQVYKHLPGYEDCASICEDLLVQLKNNERPAHLEKIFGRPLLVESVCYHAAKNGAELTAVFKKHSPFVLSLLRDDIDTIITPEDWRNKWLVQQEAEQECLTPLRDKLNARWAVSLIDKADHAAALSHINEIQCINNVPIDHALRIGHFYYELHIDQLKAGFVFTQPDPNKPEQNEKSIVLERFELENVENEKTLVSLALDYLTCVSLEKSFDPILKSCLRTYYDLPQATPDDLYALYVEFYKEKFTFDKLINGVDLNDVNFAKVILQFYQGNENISEVGKKYCDTALCCIYPILAQYKQAEKLSDSLRKAGFLYFSKRFTTEEVKLCCGAIVQAESALKQAAVSTTALTMATGYAAQRKLTTGNKDNLPHCGQKRKRRNSFSL